MECPSFARGEIVSDRAVIGDKEREMIRRGVRSDCRHRGRSAGCHADPAPAQTGTALPLQCHDNGGIVRLIAETIAGLPSSIRKSGQ